MSRLKKFKETRKQKIKSTIIGLALTISIGATGVLGSYAWFISSDSVKNNLSVKTGSLDVEISEGIMETTSKDSNGGKIYNQYFTIDNKGSLDQIVNLKLTDQSSDEEYSEEITYKLYSVEGNVETELITGKLDKLNGSTLTTIELYSENDNNENGNKTSKNFKSEIIVPKPKTAGLWLEKTIKFKLIAEAVQANASELQGGSKQ